MKKLKLIMAAIAISVSINLLFAGNPQDGNDNLANLLIDKMSKDIILSDSQKVIVKKKIKTFIVKMQNAHTLSNNSEKYALKKQAELDYQFSLDSVLTGAQREQMKVKMLERENNKGN